MLEQPGLLRLELLSEILNKFVKCKMIAQCKSEGVKEYFLWQHYTKNANLFFFFISSFCLSSFLL